MKYFLWLATTVLLVGWIVPPRLSWLSATEHDLGDIPYQQAVSHTFQFLNTGKEALIIDNVRPGCGCTIADWDEQAVPPDSIGQIIVEYDARDKGYFRKMLKVYIHGQRRAERLWLEGYVIE